MADRTESSIVVDAAPADVLDVIADFAAYPEWTGAVRQAEVLEEDENGWASTVRFTLDAGALRAAAEPDADVADWSQRWDAMVETARGRGWLSEDGATLRVHVESAAGA